MSFNWNAIETYWFVDQENKMMLIQNPSWDSNGENGKGDAIGRNMIAFYCYNDYRFIEGIESCWAKVYRKNWFKKILLGKYYYQGYRYPTYANGEEEQSEGLSRDHLLHTVLSYKLAGKLDSKIWEFVKHLRFRISPSAVQTIDLWFWMRAMAGRKFAKWISPRITFYTMKLTAWWQKKVQNFSGIGPDFEENQDTFKHIQNEDKPKIILKVCKLLHPIYALQQQAWEANFYEDKWKRKCQDVIYSITPKYNYAIKLLCEHPEGITKEDIMNYKPMTGTRWSGIMNIWWNDRPLEIIKKPGEYNVLDVDYLRKLWEENGNS